MPNDPRTDGYTNSAVGAALGQEACGQRTFAESALTLCEEVVNGRQAYVLENSRMRVSALRGGGHLAEIRLKSADPRTSINPLRVPHFPTIEPHNYDPARHDRVYGGRPDRWLQSGYMGHLLNFPTFGEPSETEARAGLGTHGEAFMVEWKKERAVATSELVQLAYSAHLPKTQYKVGREMMLHANETVLYVEEWVENLTAYDRPAHWVEHVTFGPPFAEPGKLTLDISGLQGEVRPSGGSQNSLAPGPIQWPDGTAFDGSKVSLRTMQSRPSSGTYYGVLMDPSRPKSFLTVYHQDYNLLVGYVWVTSDFPWIGDWQENHFIEEPPWNGLVVARGLEFGTTPFEGTMRDVVEEGKVCGVPVFRWIGAHQRAVTRYLVFLAEIPTGFRGVADVQARDGQIVVTERVSANVLAIDSGLEW